MQAQAGHHLSRQHVERLLMVPLSAVVPRPMSHSAANVIPDQLFHLQQGSMLVPKQQACPTLPPSYRVIAVLTSFWDHFS